MKPKTYLFPGMENNWRVDKPLTPKSIYCIVRDAAKRAGITKHVSPHCMRHSWATHLLESGEDLRKIQLLLGHSDLETTSRYLHLSTQHLHSVTNPVEALPVSTLDTVKRSGRKKKE
jgi:site-specific recombinase XerD